MLRARYLLTGTLKIGRVATVYRAKEVETNRAVTVKIFHEVGRNDWGRIQSFHRSTSSRALKPELPSGFVAVHECDLTDEGQLFLVTELVQGPSVADLLRRTPPLAPERALELATRIGEALEAALNLGLLDLPLAPGDIIVDDADHVRLLRSDVLILQRLGLADQLVAAEATERDPRYASPEELAGLPTTERSVVYRFGILLYELLCGSPPFEGIAPAEVRERQLRPPLRQFRDRHRALPASLDRLVSRMLDPDPVARPVDLTLILNELWDAACHLQAETPSAPTDATSSANVAPATPVRRSRTRRWVLAGLPIVVVGGMLVAGPYLTGRPTSVPAPVQPVVDVPPPPAPVEPPPSLVLPPSHPATSSSRASTQVPEPPAERPARVGGQPAAGRVDGNESSARVGSNAPALPRVTQSESPLASADTRAVNAAGAPVREPPPPARPAEAPVPRRAAGRVEPEPRSAGAAPAPPSQSERVVTPPPTRPSEPHAEESRAVDPRAIIEWLVRTSR